jgi:Xaa-Pro dipeptidase
VPARAIKAAVPPETLDRRFAEIVRGLEAENLDAAIFTTPESILYISGVQVGGFWSQQAVVIGRGGEHRFVVRAIESHWHDNWAPQTWCTYWATYSDQRPAAEVIGDAVKSVAPGSKRLGVELARNSVSYQTVQSVMGATGAEELLPVSYLVERLRVIKQPEEIAHLREAGRISRLGHEAAAQALRNGATDAEAVAVGTSVLYGEGSEFVALGPLIAIGAESAMAHPPWRREPARPGEIATVETSASVHRYQGPIERTYVKLSGLNDGRSAEETQRLLRLVVDCGTEAIKHLRPGMTSHEADSIARSFFAAEGVSEYFINRLGYSIGLAFPPVWWENDIMQLRPNDERQLEAGMTFHLVPALHVPGLGLITQSRAVVITDTGCEPLNDMPLELEPF